MGCDRETCDAAIGLLLVCLVGAVVLFICPFPMPFVVDAQPLSRTPFHMLRFGEEQEKTFDKKENEEDYEFKFVFKEDEICFIIKPYNITMEHSNIFDGRSLQPESRPWWDTYKFRGICTGGSDCKPMGMGKLDGLPPPRERKQFQQLLLYNNISVTDSYKKK